MIDTILRALIVGGWVLGHLFTVCILIGIFSVVNKLVWGNGLDDEGRWFDNHRP